MQSHNMNFNQPPPLPIPLMNQSGYHSQQRTPSASFRVNILQDGMRIQIPQPQNIQQFNNIYREKTNKKKDMKNFTLRSFLLKKSIKTKIKDDSYLQISFKTDALIDFFLRINVIVTEKKDMYGNTQAMFTPDSKNYVIEKYIKKGMGIESGFEEVQFNLAALVAYQDKLFKSNGNDHPIVFSLYYTYNGKNISSVNYGVFTKDDKKTINGISIEQQIIIINGKPFEMKNIYGINETETATPASDQAIEGVAEDEQGKECLICLAEERSIIIMPCGHLCVCNDCADKMFQKNYTCPICRGKIVSLVPFEMSKKKKR
ncbi:ring finger 1-like protein [Stylonychia lemnae]|uniref:Ring finger 1-like protein n=1 Tax=Stylonychia lemnae TaxID=5949 RepID=A0A078A4V5_STYLE|nr:ring finger 1-like protein [Stylonychia lemnae]|eukprot:CDW77224.1 ring finger 1-like protein [Stylonychia lemnae]